MEILDGQLEHPRGVDGPHAGGQRRTECHRDLASELARSPHADHSFDAVDHLRQLGRSFDDDGQEPAVPLVRHVFAGDEVDVLDGAGKELQLFLTELGEEWNGGQLFDSEHDRLPTVITCGFE